jgi:hypothetical protein
VWCREKEDRSNMAQSTTQPKKKMLWSHRIHFIFMALFGVAAVALILLPIAWINYTITFQSGLLYFTLYSFGIITLSQPDKDGRVKKTNRVILCTSLFVSLACIAICAINPLTIIVTECPKYDRGNHHYPYPHHHHAKKSPHYESIAPYTRNTLDVLVKYDKYTDGVDLPEENVLSLRYNLTGKVVERREWDSGDNSWKTTVHQYHATSLDPVCSTEKYSRFLFLESEIEEEMRDRRAHLESMSSIRYSSHDNSKQTTPEEDQFDLNRWTKRICRNEVGFTIAYLVFMAILFVLEVVALFWYAFQMK